VTRIAFASMLLAINLATPSRAQVYPSRPITMIVPLPAGSAFDVAARLVAERMQTFLGQPIVVDNVTGASGSVGTGRVARAAPDGYTLVFGGLITHVINPATLSLSYDPVEDFEPVALIAATPLLIISRKDIPANDLKTLIAWLKDNPNNATQGTGGPGSLTHVAGIFFQRQTGTRFRTVPYRGASAAINDIIAGHIDFMFDLAPNSLPHLSSGTIKAYAVTAHDRLTGASNIPTVDEAGLPSFYMAAWQAIWAPKRTPPGIIEKLNAAVVDALASPALRARLAGLGQQSFPHEEQSAQALARLHEAERQKWWPIIKAESGKPQ
jgi:tripartite-type tricarboxylate transporter receptor subunit TctC